MADERDDDNPDLRSGTDHEVAEVTEVTTVSTGPLPGESVVAPPLAGAGEIIEVAPGLVAETERVEVLPDGSVERTLDRVEQPAVARRRSGPNLGAALLVILLVALGAIAAAWYLTRETAKDVPAVVGLPLDQAVQRLQDEGFKSDISSSPNPEDEGIVYEQRPSSGSSAEEGSTVLVLVSKGPETVAIPNTVGVTEADARDRLAEAGFEVNAVKVFADEAEGTVTAQSPAAGGQAAKGSAVRINVSKGTGLVTVPNVVGQPRDDAESEVTQLGLKTNTVTVPSPEPAGTVVAQNPTGGQLRQGESVRLNVSAGP